MARAYDRRPLPIDRNPLWSIMGGGVGNLPKLDAQKLWQGWLDSFKLFTGIDLSSPAKLVESIADKIGDALDPATVIAEIKDLTHLDLSSPQALVASIGALITGSGDGGLIDPSRLPQIPLANIVQLVASVLPGGAFDGLESVVDQLEHWSFDNSTGEGAAKVTADGAIHDLYSGDLIPVKAGEVLHITGKARWAGLVATGNPVEIGVTGYTDKAGTSSAGRAAVAWPVTPSGTLPDWQTLAGTYTVPNGVVAVRLRLTLNDTATAGTVSFTGVDANKGNNLLPLNFVADLPSRLAALLDFSTWQQFLDAAKGSPGGAISDLIGRIVHLGVDGTFDASQLVNVPNMPDVPGTKVTGMTGSVLQDISTHVNNVVTKFLGIRVNEAGHSFDDAAAAMGTIYNQVQTSAQQLQDLIALQTGDAHSGRTYKVNFADLPDGPFPTAQFALTYSGSGSGFVEIKDGRGVWHGVADGDRQVLGKYQGDSLTDYQNLAATVSTPMDNGAKNWILGRCNAAADTFVYALGTRNSLVDFRAELGCFVAGHQFVFASNVPANLNFNLSLKVGTFKGLRNFQVFSGNEAIIDYTDAAGISQVGPNYRGWGFLSQTSNGGANIPAEVALVSMADADPAAATGSGAKMSRLSTSNVNVQSGRHLAATNFYDSLELATPDITADVPNAKFTVRLAGWYRVEIAFSLNSFAGASSFQVAPVLYKNGQPHRVGTDAYGFQAFGAGTAARFAQTSFGVYLDAGDSVQVGYDSGAAIVITMSGEPSGIETYFGISLLNRSLG
ncbi:minor tail protein [Mycobacterium phage Keshu]|uniref:Minor tail protein n=1 Tax=Mycobacterium phage Keshu TaxID=1567471 RepID=A0A0B5A5A4_9CAUD|nr:minor tail protein [Mycobacterium phage Keshu]AJD82246.1 minor tail protein [Mycobacterium phage Keshu]